MNINNTFNARIDCQHIGGVKERAGGGGSRDDLIMEIILCRMLGASESGFKRLCRSRMSEKTRCHHGILSTAHFSLFVDPSISGCSGGEFWATPLIELLVMLKLYYEGAGWKKRAGETDGMS
jgi:hypothetical protein